MLLAAYIDTLHQPIHQSTRHPLKTFLQQQQQQQLAQQQQQAAALQKQLLAQQMLAGGGLAGLALGAGLGAAPVSDKKQREVYIGNLAVGQVTGEMLREFFNQAFAHMVPDPVAQPPVTRSAMDPQSRYAFMEFFTEEMTLAALAMDKAVELCGRAMHVGRPKGWVPPAPAAEPAALVAPAPLPAAPAPLPTLLLSNALPCGQLRAREDREVLADEVREEAARHGAVEAVAVPEPPPGVQDGMPGRVYVRYASPADAKAAVAIFHGRTLDDNVIKTVLVPDDEWDGSRGGAWVSRHSSIAGIPLPGR